MKGFNFSFDLPEKVSTNTIYAGKFWAKRRDMAENFHSMLLEQKGRFHIAPEDYPIALSFRFRFRNKPLDASNCTYMAKMIEDGMCAIGLLEDDDPDHVGVFAIASTKDKSIEHDSVVVYVDPL